MKSKLNNKEKWSAASLVGERRRFGRGVSFFVLIGGVLCFLLLVASPLFRVGWCGCSSIEGFCRGVCDALSGVMLESASMLRMRVFSAASVSEEWLFW